MLTEREIRDLFGALRVDPWEGVVYRHMFAGLSPYRENTRGARWNPAGVSAIYSSLARDTALAEANYRLSLESVPLRRDIKRTIYAMSVNLHAVVDLGSIEKLRTFEIDESEMQGESLQACQQLGNQVDWFGYDGLLVPSVRHLGQNLVIYPSHFRADCFLSITSEETLDG